jgi:TRAP transporter TAXI family solute receptor
MRRWFLAWLNSLTAAEIALVFCGLFFFISLIGVALVHPHMRRVVHGKRQVNDVVIFVAANFGLVYAILLGLLVVATFQITKDLQDHIANEASSLATMYRSTDAYPEPLRSELRAQLRDYTHYVIEKDWPAHRQVRVLVGGDHRLQAIRQKLFSFEPKTASQAEIHREMLRYFNAMNVAREQRQDAVFSSIPDVLWYVLLIGALVTIVFLWMLHMDLLPQILFGGITAVFLGTMIFLIYAMDHPLQGAVSVGPDALQSVYDLEMKWEDPATRATTVALGTGELHGVYYPVGLAICEVIDRDTNKYGVRCSAEGTPGSAYNLDAIRSGNLEFGIIQSDVAYAAFNGEGAYANRPFDDLRSVLSLYPELVTILVRADSGIHQIADLAGRRINIGRVGSGAFAIWGALEAALGWRDGQRERITDLPAGAASHALCAGEIDANLMVIGHPSGTVRMQLAACATRFVTVSGPEMDALASSASYLQKASIPGGLYGLASDTPTIGVNAIVMTSASENTKAVAAFAQAIIAQIGDLRTKHPALANVTVEEMTGGNFPVPLHPAASLVYKDLGLLR